MCFVSLKYCSKGVNSGDHLNPVFRPVQEQANTKKRPSAAKRKYNWDFVGSLKNFVVTAAENDVSLIRNRTLLQMVYRNKNSWRKKIRCDGSFGVKFQRPFVSHYLQEYSKKLNQTFNISGLSFTNPSPKNGHDLGWTHSCVGWPFGCAAGTHFIHNLRAHNPNLKQIRIAPTW